MVAMLSSFAIGGTGVWWRRRSLAHRDWRPCDATLPRNPLLLLQDPHDRRHLDSQIEFGLSADQREQGAHDRLRRRMLLQECIERVELSRVAAERSQDREGRHDRTG